jgi:hypothetical protein
MAQGSRLDCGKQSCSAAALVVRELKWLPHSASSCVEHRTIRID